MTATELLRDELTLSPARTARMLRMTTIVALVVVISMALRVPEVAVSAYMIFFFAQRDVATTLLTGVAAVIGLTVALVLCFLCFLVTVDEPGLRLPLMVVLAFGGMYLMRATAAGALGLVIGFITYYVLTYADQVPSPELLVRALLWIWVVIAYPVALLVVADLAFGSRPDEVFRSGIADRLAAAADFLAATPEEEARARARLSRFVRLGASDLVPYVDRGGPAAMAPIRATLLRQSELLGFLLRELPDEFRRDAAAEPALRRASVACDGARNALVRGDDATTGHFELLAAERRALAGTTPAVRAVVLPLVNCIQTIVLSVRELVSAPMAEPGLSLRPPKPESPADATEAARFAFKVTLAAMTAYLLYSGLEWYSIHTATITCFFVAEDSVGATIHKLTLRLTGAIIGAALGMLAIVLVLPAFESVGGLVVLVAAVTLLAAWVGTASSRISYAGWQIAIAFYLTVLQGFSRTSKLYVGRDRVIGILIGNILMSVVFTSLWPVRAVPEQRRALSRTIEAMAALLHAKSDDRGALDRAEADFYTHLTRARQYLPLVRFERPRDDRALVLTVVQGLFIPLHAIVRAPVPATASPDARNALSNATSSLSDWLRAFATSIASQGPLPPLPPADEAHATLERIANDASESRETRARLADQIAWLELLRAHGIALVERRSS
ncbi:MAG: Fusaric acid resistance family protein [bacterium]|nr:Fusaric acid resistance family protein [bacterium]